MLTQSSRHIAWCTQPAWCPFLHAAAPDIRWSDLQSSRLHLPQPSGCRSDGHKEFGRLSGISSKRRTLFGGINSMFPRAPEKYRLTLQMSGVWVRSRRKNSSSDNSKKIVSGPKVLVDRGSHLGL